MREKLSVYSDNKINSAFKTILEYLETEITKLSQMLVELTRERMEVEESLGCLENSISLQDPDELYDGERYRELYEKRQNLISQINRCVRYIDSFKSYIEKINVIQNICEQELIWYRS